MRIQRPWLILGVIAAVAICIGLLVLLWQPGSSEGEASGPAPDAPPPPAAVLLIPGYGGDPGPLSALGESLNAEGYDVAVLDIGSGTGDIEEYAAAAVERSEDLLNDGAPSVSTVGFSMGGLIGRVAAVDSPDLFSNVISLASPHEGTLLAVFGGSACPDACQQMQPGSALLTSLPDAPDEDIWLSVYSQTDGTIIPAESSSLSGATVLTVQSVCPASTVRHSDVPRHPLVIGAVAAALAGEALPASCPVA